MKIKLRETLKQLIIRNINNYSSLYFNVEDNLFSILQKFKIMRIASFYPKKNEINILNTMYILEKLGYILALPKIEGNLLSFRKWEINDILCINHFNIYEPSLTKSHIIPDIIITPLLGYDRKGYRLGYGGGYYDRTLIYYPNAIKIGLCYSCQEVDNIPTELHDIPLNYIITEKEIINI